MYLTLKNNLNLYNLVPFQIKAIDLANCLITYSFTTQSINMLWILKRKVSLRQLFCLPIISMRKSEKKLEMCQLDTNAPPRAVVGEKKSLYRMYVLNTLCTCVSVADNM